MPEYETNWEMVEVQCSDSTCAPSTFIPLAPRMADDQSAVISLSWSQEVMDMSMRIYTVDSNMPDKYCVTEPGVENSADCAGAPVYTLDSQGGVGGDAVTLPKSKSTDPRRSYMVAVGSGTQPTVSSLSIADSIITYQDRQTVRKVYQDMKFVFENSVRGVLMFGEWGAIGDIFQQTEEQQRNTLIMQLVEWSSLSLKQLEAMSDSDLMDAGWIAAFLKVYGIQPESSMRLLDIQEQRKVAAQTISTHNGVVAAFRQSTGNNYLNSMDIQTMLQDTQFKGSAIVDTVEKYFHRTNSEAGGRWWISGCLQAVGEKLSWVSVGQYVDDIYPHFCQELFYGRAEQVTSKPLLERSGLMIFAHSSQDNSKLAFAKVSVRKIDSTGATVIATDADFGSDGSVFIPITTNGKYNIEVTAADYIAYTFEMTVACEASDCVTERLISLTPKMEPGQTKIILNWHTEDPKDLDMHILSVDKNKDTCETDWTHKDACTKVKLDLDNTKGGLAGAETVTLLDAAVTSKYRYAISVVDYDFNANGIGGGVSFLKSQASVQILNNNGKERAEKAIRSTLTELKQEER
jgi:hypothetical protein